MSLSKVFRGLWGSWRPAQTRTGAVRYRFRPCLTALEARWLPSTIVTVAGTGMAGLAGDNIPATSSKLSLAEGVAVDREGNVFIGDFFSNRVLEVVKATGLIITVAGTGEEGFNGDNIPATSAQLTGPTAVALDGEGNLYI
jgi:hypothetical protein